MRDSNAKQLFTVMFIIFPFAAAYFVMCYSFYISGVSSEKACFDYCKPINVIGCIHKDASFFNPRHVNVLAVCDKNKDGEQVKEITTP